MIQIMDRLGRPKRITYMIIALSESCGGGQWNQVVVSAVFSRIGVITNSQRTWYI